MSFWEGLVGGFTGARDANILREQEADAGRRASEAKVFEHLLSSNDPEMRALAMTGLLEASQPGKRSGFQGYLGKVQGGQVYPRVLSRMNEMVLEEPTQPGGGPAPPSPGAAAMPGMSPVEPGSPPMNLPGQPLPPEAAPPGAQEAIGAPPPMGPTPGAPGMPPPPPPVSKWKRRGTGVPTAEEIAEMQATAPIRARIKMVTEELTRRGAPPEVIQRAIMGIAGAPASQTQFEEVGYGVRLIKDGPVLPVTLDRASGKLKMTNGQDVPPNAEMVRLGGSMGGGLTTTIRDSPALRAQYGIDPGDVTPSGYWKIKELPNGSVQVMPAEYTPPPAYSGTTEILEPGTNIPVRAPVLRGGGVGAPIGDVADQVPAQAQTDAQALKEIIDRVISDTRIADLPLNPARRDQVTQQEARKLGLPFTTYNEVVQAMRSTPPVTPRQRLEGQESLADRIEKRLRGTQGMEAPAPPPPPPARPPVRGRGAGPRQ